MTEPRELSVTLFIDAAPARVWQVMTDRQEEWWCPVPWHAKVVRQDRRAGGACEMTFHGPDGEFEPQNGIYLAYDEGRRFVTTDAAQIADDGHFVPSGPFMIGSWEVAPEGNGTRYTARARHWTDETMKQHDEMGFTEGWTACAMQLKALCEAA
jgi:uncharacterized protein YndB with AHSA1/START domain